MGQNNYYALMAKEFRTLGVHVPINEWLTAGAASERFPQFRLSEGTRLSGECAEILALRPRRGSRPGPSPS